MKRPPIFNPETSAMFAGVLRVHRLDVGQHRVYLPAADWKIRGQDTWYPEAYIDLPDNTELSVGLQEMSVETTYRTTGNAKIAFYWCVTARSDRAGYLFIGTLAGMIHAGMVLRGDKMVAPPIEDWRPFWPPILARREDAPVIRALVEHVNDRDNLTSLREAWKYRRRFPWDVLPGLEVLNGRRVIVKADPPGASDDILDRVEIAFLRWRRGKLPYDVDIDIKWQRGVVVTRGEYPQDPCRTRTYKIGKFIKDDPDLVRAFNSRVKESEWEVMISDDPEDIFFMSEGKGWTSCMRRQGAYPDGPIADSMLGETLIAYVYVRGGKTPTGRMLIRLLPSRDGATVRVERAYGTVPKGVQRWIRDKVHRMKDEEALKRVHPASPCGRYIDSKGSSGEDASDLLQVLGAVAPSTWELPVDLVRMYVRGAWPGIPNEVVDAAVDWLRDTLERIPANDRREILRDVMNAVWAKAVSIWSEWGVR